MSTAPAVPALERVLHAEPVPLRACVPLLAGGAAAHGLALGASSGEWLMAIYSAIKVPILLLVSTAITLPNFYVLHGALGLQSDFRAACRGIVAAQAGLAIALGATAPIVVVIALSVRDPYLLTVLDGLLFALAVGAGQLILRRHYRPLLARNGFHRATLLSWAVLYVFFAIQFSWVLRPFLGTPGFPVEFLRSEAFEQNAYVVLWDHLVRAWR